MQNVKENGQGRQGAALPIMASPCTKSPSSIMEPENNLSSSFAIAVTVSSAAAAITTIAVKKSHRKSNRDLTPAEREAKQLAKSKLKLDNHWDWLERRLRRAKKQKDHDMEREAQEALSQWEAVHPTIIADADAAGEESSQGVHGTGEDGSVTNDSISRGTMVVIEIHRLLQQTIMGGEKCTRQDQDLSLLKHTRKGTQQLTMFGNTNALWGYSQTKFLDRAALVLTSLARLDPGVRHKRRGGSQHNLLPSPSELSLQRSIWDELQQVRSACSLGLGPGCNAVGLISFLQSHYGQHQSSSSTPVPSEKTRNARCCLDRLLLLDFAALDWRFITDPLSSILVPGQVGKLDAEFCDVTRESLPRELLCGPTTTSLLTDAEQPNVAYDMVLVSFLLTETHGGWETFLIEMITCSREGTLFYFAEPRPWQLHRVKQLCSGLLAFVWLDSSMNDPSLQTLGTRVGTASGAPSVMIGIKQ